MTIEEQIAELLAKAAPLRLLPDDEAEEKGLPGIVEQINALRALPPGEEAPKRGPGRPRKAE
ncbi:MAG: hypothetical protein ACOVN9_15010 [Inhella sp.]|jgi:hypothetical protein